MAHAQTGLHIMSKNLRCALALIATVAPLSAYAADLATYPVKAAVVAPVPAFSWTGFYLGGYVGWGQTSTDYDSTISIPSLGSASSSSTITRDGVIGGAFAGYNYQIDQMVLGAEADIAFMTMGDERYAAGENFVTAHTNFVGSVRGRLGYAFDHALVYATGGLAFASADTNIPLTAISINDGDGTRWGWTLGAGTEYALSDHWIAGVEYRYTQYETADHSYSLGSPTIANVAFSQQPSVNQVTARLAYKF